MAFLDSSVRALVEFAAGDVMQRALWAAAALAAMLAVGGLTRRHRFSVRTIAIVVSATALFAQPALANFTASDAPAATFAASNIAASTGLTCSFTSGTAVSLSWTASATTWADNNYVNRNSSEVGSTGARTTVTYSDTGLTPESTSYSWTIKAGKNNWRGDPTSSLAATSCTGATPAVSTIAQDAVTARTQNPEAMAVDSSGNIYIADTANHCIRKVTASTGNIAAISGLCGTSGSAGNGGAANAAAVRFNTPTAIAVDGSGNIYVADTNNNQVRKFSIGGNINTFAGTGTASWSGDGGAATSATLDHPAGVAIDSHGNVFISDRANARVRAVLASNGNIYAIAGTGTASDNGVGNPATNFRLNVPSQLAIDSSDNLFVADRSNNKVRKLACASNCNSATMVYTSAEIAGTGLSGYTGDSGQAGSAKLATPYSVAVDSSENLYIADSVNNVIRKVAPGVNGTLESTDTITTYAGSGTNTAGFEGYPLLASNFSTPEGVHWGADGKLYIADTNHHQIRRVTTHGNVVTVAGGGSGGTTDGVTAASAALVKPQGLAVDTFTSPVSVIIADSGDNRIRRWWSDTQEVATIAGTGTSGSSGDTGDAAAAKVASAEGVAVDSSGNIYIADTGNHKIRKITQSTNVMSTYAGTGSACAASCDNATGTSAKFKSPSDLVVDTSSNLFVADTSDHAIRKVAAAGSNAVTTIAGTILSSGSTGVPGQASSALLNSPDGVGIDSSNNLYIADTTNNRILKITAGDAVIDATDTVSKVEGTAAQNTSCAGTASTGVTLNAPGDVVAVDSEVYVADTGRHQICRITAGGTSSAYMGTGGSNGTTGDTGVPGSALIDTPNGIAYGSTAGLFVAHNITNGRVRKVTAPLVVG